MLSEIRLGSQGAVLMEFFRESWGIILFGVLMVVFSMGLLAGGLVLRIRSGYTEYSMFLSAGMLYCCPRCGCFRIHRSCSC